MSSLFAKVLEAQEERESEHRLSIKKETRNNKDLLEEGVHGVSIYKSNKTRHEI